MVRRLQLLGDRFEAMSNRFRNAERLDELLSQDRPVQAMAAWNLDSRIAVELLRSGQSEAAAELLTTLMTPVSASPEQWPEDSTTRLLKLRAIARMRQGEQQNCLQMHGARSCLFPIDPAAIHHLQAGSRAAMVDLAVLLHQDSDDLVSRWLYNLAAQTIGAYPDEVSVDWLISPSRFESRHESTAFDNRAVERGVAASGLAGGVVMDDFNGDGLLDIMASSWGHADPLRLFINRGDGPFEDRSHSSGLDGLTGGLNLIQADYDNDGDLDVLVLRGAWLGAEGRLPNSLLQNQGDGRFVDVTESSGLLSFLPSQTAAWLDVNQDGWLDLFIGNESAVGGSIGSELYINRGDGRFDDIAAQAGIHAQGMIKAVTAGDIDNDGRPDLYVSRLGQSNLLFRNLSDQDAVRFEEQSEAAGVHEPLWSFPAWFFDYDNDGHLDLFVADYFSEAYFSSTRPSSGRAAAHQVVARYLGHEVSSEPRLYRNRGDGTFTAVQERMGLDWPTLAMGANFGDIDNDGFPDLYLGTGDPEFDTLIPNRLFHNHQARTFDDVTTSTATGHLQKGHGIAFGDIDQDGDQDIYAVMGGAYSGDVFQNALFVNPGNAHRWVTLKLEGTASNRSAIGARVRITCRTADGPRDIQALVGSGGSFGASSLQQEIGLGEALSIEQVEIRWPSGTRQLLGELALDQRHVIREPQ